nr:hypothetical protein [Pseudomonas sp. NBRC 111143]
MRLSTGLEQLSLCLAQLHLQLRRVQRHQHLVFLDVLALLYAHVGDQPIERCSEGDVVH